MPQPILTIKNNQDLNNLNVANLTEFASKQVTGAEKDKRFQFKNINQDQKNVESSSDDDDCCFVEMNKSSETIVIDDDSEIDEISEKSATPNQAQKRRRQDENQLNNINYEEEIDRMKSLNFKEIETKMGKSKDQTMTTRNDSVLFSEESDEPLKKFQKKPKRKRMKKNAIHLQNDSVAIDDRVNRKISLLCSSTDFLEEVGHKSMESSKMPYNQSDKRITKNSVLNLLQDPKESNLQSCKNQKQNIQRSRECSETSLSSKSIGNISKFNNSDFEAFEPKAVGNLQNMPTAIDAEITEVIDDDVVQNLETIEIDDDDDEQELSPSNPSETQENFVCNLSYFECHEGTMMKCNIENCNFTTSVDNNLKYHVKLNHFTVTWNRSCLMCQTASSSTGSLLDECNHMLDIHIYKDSLNIAEKSEKSDGNQETEELEEQIDTYRTESADELNCTEETDKSLPKIVTQKYTDKKTLETATKQLSKFNVQIFECLNNPEPKSKPKTVLIQPEQTLQSASVNSSANYEVSSSSDDPVTSSLIVKPFVKSLNASSTSSVTRKLRPWLSCMNSKHPDKVAAMLKPECLLSTYKCMGSMCNFFTNDTQKFSFHLRMHKILFDREDSTDYVKCAYCEFSGTYASSLIAHMNATHSNENFPCSKCFYRSVSKENLRNHLNKYHDKTLQTFLNCNYTKILTIDETTKEAVELRQTNVLPIKCPGEVFSLSSKQIHITIVVFFHQHVRRNSTSSKDSQNTSARNMIRRENLRENV
jgi:hypothetical protein